MKLRWFLDPYVIFMLFPLGFAFFSAFYSAQITGAIFEEYIEELVVAVLTVVTGMYAVHNIDYMLGGYTDAPSRFRLAIFYIFLSIAVFLALILCYITTWWILPFVISGAAMSVCYSAELFGGKLHEIDAYGQTSLGWSFGFVPSFVASMIVKNISISSLFLAVGFMIFSAGLLNIWRCCREIPHRIFRFNTSDEVHPTREESAKMTFKAVIWILISLWIWIIGIIAGYGGV